MDMLKATKAMAALGDILGAAQVLERHNLLPEGEKSNDVVKRYVAAHPEINEMLSRTDA
jgi:hypothetical protein